MNRIKVSGGGVRSTAPAPRTVNIRVQPVSADFKSGLVKGNAAHAQYSEMLISQGQIANKAVLPNSKLRPDGYRPATNTVMELKPGNPRGVKNGQAQLEEYTKLSNGPGELWLYNENIDGTFNFWKHKP